MSHKSIITNMCGVFHIQVFIFGYCFPINIDILAIIATNVVTIVGIASYTSGDQKWNGAALTLNKNPTLNISKEKFM